MKDKLLIDTSAWIVSFKKAGHEKLKQKIIDALGSASALTTNIIVLEVLQGCRDRKEYEKMKSYLEALELLTVNDAVWDAAYEAGYALRKAGITVPTVDIIIASLAKVYGCPLLHHDGHFKLIAKRLDIKAVDFIGQG
jgi:predicted nucleic acid-binding protein